MEMDCYPEYKHHIHPNHQHYNSNNATANHPYYAGNYGPSSMRYAHAHASFENGQQQNWIDGYTRYNHGQHHLNHHGNYTNSFNGHYGTTRDSYGHGNGGGSEGSGQFYYQNAHQTSAGYYGGNHSYDSYRNASSGYHYHYGNASNGGGAASAAANATYHQTQSHPSPSQYYAPYNGTPSEQQQQQFNNRYYPTPPPSAPPSSSQRDPYTISHQNESAPSPYAPNSSIETDLNEKQHQQQQQQHNNEMLSNNEGKSSSVDPIAPSPQPPLVRPSTENATESDERKAEVQQTKIEESLRETSANKCEELQVPQSGSTTKEAVKAEDENSNGCEVERGFEATKNENQSSHHSTSLFNENSDHNQHQSCNESSTKTNSVHSQELASDVENSIATGKLKREKKNFFHELSIFTKRRRKFSVLFIFLRLAFASSSSCN